MDIKVTKIPHCQVTLWYITRERAYKLDGGRDNSMSP